MASLGVLPAKAADLMGYFSYNGDGAGITKITFNAVHNFGGFDFESFPDLTSISFPNLIGVDEAGACKSYFQISDNPNLTTIDLPVFQQINTDGTLTGGYLEFSRNPKLTTVNMPALVSVVAYWNMFNSPLLTTLSFPNLVMPGGGGGGANNMDFHGNALDAASVNGILARLVASPNWGTNGRDTLWIDRGTNAAPTGQGITDKATLITRGATVVTN
jgi:hypothetical protein